MMRNYSSGIEPDFYVNVDVNANNIRSSTALNAKKNIHNMPYSELETSHSMKSIVKLGKPE